MIKVHDGSIEVNGDKVRRIKVDSESAPDERHYYVTVVADPASNNYGGLLGCDCKARGLDPTRHCKHMRAIVEQRMLQTS